MGLHRVLDGDATAPVPMEWWLSRLCEEFHCLPSEALKEWGRMPVDTLETIIEFRAYAVAKVICDRAQKRSEIPETVMTNLVQEIDFALANA